MINGMLRQVLGVTDLLLVPSVKPMRNLSLLRGRKYMRKTDWSW
jgi:hypothetical protein